MNWLAHLFLSENHIVYQHGNLLADLLKGRSWDGADARFDAGLAMHRSIDRFTDDHPVVARSKTRLGERGCLKGVVIDITYDHLLAKNWARFSRISLTEFVFAFHMNTPQALSHYPRNAQAFLNRLTATGHLLEYASFSAIEKALGRIDARLSPRVLRRETTSRYLPLVRRRMADLEDDFLLFMPDLITHFKALSEVTLDEHWLK